MVDDRYVFCTNITFEKESMGGRETQEHTSGKPGWWLKFDDVYQYTSHWLLLNWKVITQSSSAIVDFYSYYDGPVDMQIQALLTRILWRISDTRMTVEDPGPLVYQREEINIQMYKNNVKHKF